MSSTNKYLQPLLTQFPTNEVKLNNPFEYRPSKVILEAQQLLMNHIGELANSDKELDEELARGKMFGVIVVSDSQGHLGYLSAFSGCISGRVELDNFVPPIFGRGVENPEYADEDRRITELTLEIEQLKSSAEYRTSQELFDTLRADVEMQIAAAHNKYEERKAERDTIRKSTTDSATLQELNRESQHQKGEIKRLEHTLKGELKSAKERMLAWRDKLSQMQEQRRKMSNELQCKMFKDYHVVNGNGEWQSLYQIFDELLDRLPPSGAGECAAPKLLHYALTNNLRPIALGEFWYGPSPRGEVRHHGHFYGACRSRCYPILSFMLQGVDVAPIEADLIRESRDPLGVLYEDDYLVVFNKPAGMLSVPGRSSAQSLYSIARSRYPDATGTMVVHRLDQDTSGVMVIAKSREVQIALQRQFSERSLSKRYIAVVDGAVKNQSGEITLPLIPNIYDRPRQMVDYERGKASHTTYEVMERGSDFTRLALYPHTGRTHQLRLHCAHPEGLNTPIKGDRLYGAKISDATTTLHLHAEQITFSHPISGEKMTIRCDATF